MRNNMNAMSKELIMVARDITAEPRINESGFWKIIEKLNWSGDYKETSKYLHKNFSQTQISDIENLVDAKVNQLKKVLDKYQKDVEEIPVSDDGYSDLLYHLVGSGKKEYETALKDPSYARAICSEAPESFAYVFQTFENKDDYEEDFKKFTVELAALSKKYGVAIQSVGGVEFGEIKSIRYSSDPTSGDLTYTKS